MVVLSMLCTACGPDPGPTTPSRTLDWNVVPLVAGLTPSVLAVAGDSVLVGGRRDDGGPRPGLATVAVDGTVAPLPLEPNSPYAEVADLASLATDGSTVYALGRAHGGAHANFRWTTWRGTVADGLVDEPQTFQTFGGQQAGGLLDVVLTDEGAAIAGSWSSVDGIGLDAAVWRPKGTRWVREESAGGALANTREVQVAPRAAAAYGSTTIIAGSVITFPDGVRQGAAVWTQAGRREPWRLVRLPDPGRTSEALSAACAEACWVSGHADGQVALWRMAPTGEAAREAALPAQPIDVEGPGPRTFVLQGRPGVLSSTGGKTTLLIQDEGGWTTVPGPDGTVFDAVVRGDRLYAIIGGDTETRLWVASL